MIRDYIKSVYEEDFQTIMEDVGSGEVFLKGDGVYNNLFSDLIIYTDAAYKIPLNPASYEMSVEDDFITANELVSNGGSGKTVYSTFKILDPTYQSGFIYIEYSNFGTYTNGTAVGKDYIEIPDADYAFTIEPTVYETIIDCKNITANRTITFTKGVGANIRNKVTIINSTTYRVVLTDTTDTYWCDASDSFQVYFYAKFTRSKGWGLIYENTTPNSRYASNTLLLEPYSKDNMYMGSMRESSAVSSITYFGRYITSTGQYTGSDYSSGNVPYYDVGNSRFDTGAAVNWFQIWKYYQGL